jgi:hypothetical protein
LPSLAQPDGGRTEEIKMSLSHQIHEKIGDPYCHRRRAVKA